VGHDYIEELIELVASRHRDGLRILSGEAPPPTKEELREIFQHHRSQSGRTDPAIRVPGKNAAPQAVAVESVDPYFSALQVVGWNAIVAATSNFAQDFKDMWKVFVLYITLVEKPGWTPRSEPTSVIITISQKTGGLDIKMIRKYRKDVPGRIACLARMPQRFLF